jgi:hypothetical protein
MFDLSATVTNLGTVRVLQPSTFGMFVAASNREDHDFFAPVMLVVVMPSLA